ncbi:Xaa-Pro aminopeptidase [Bradyrhizobium sp. S3.3.6]|uniref:Xaa-Pro peptidase family protein n=1 Tax=Bradyrhizobium sp. S3.3.6 TaxID=3156429 RepID=UPI003392E8D2
MLTSTSSLAPSIPFDTELLDDLMEEAGIDVLLTTSKHNVQYLLGGHRAFFFDYKDAIGTSRYLPIVIYFRGELEKTAFFGTGLESHQRDVKAFWTPEQNFKSSGSVDVTRKAVEYIKKIGNVRRLGVEMAFLPMDSAATLSGGLPDVEIVDGLFVLERLRARKSPGELELLRIASESVIASMEAVFAKHGAGTTKQEIVDTLKVEEVSRGLTFEYCLIAAGTSYNRAPSGQRWEEGDVLSLDSGGNLDGYIGDVSRMAILGEPDAELVDLLAQIEDVQRAAMKPVRPGAMGGEIYASAEGCLARSKQRSCIQFLAHGMGLVGHEAPRLTATGPVPYDAYDATRPLESGMVVSIETTLMHPKRGFIKLEDTVAVTDTGFEIYGEGARGWNRGGTARPR